MGRTLTTRTRVSWPSATLKDTTTCTTTPLRSRAEQRGIFSTPLVECLHEGRPTGDSSLALVSFDSAENRPYQVYSQSLALQSPTLPLTPGSTPNSSVESLPLSSFSASNPRLIPRKFASPAQAMLATPPLTPDFGSGRGVSAISSRQSSAALDFLTTLFPRSGVSALPHARSVKITSPGLGAVWDGIILDLPDPVKPSQRKKTLYVDGKGAEHVQLRESIVALLDLADEHFACSAFVIALDRKSPALSDLLHSLMYVGGTVVTSPPFAIDPAYVLVGMEM